MGPVFSRMDLVDRCNGDPVACGDERARFAPRNRCPYLYDLSLHELRTAILASFEKCLATFAHLVVRVVEVCSSAQMARIAAGRIIATVEYVQAFWDGTVCDGPGQPRGIPARNGLTSSGAGFVIAKTAVAFRSAEPSPRPARVWTTGSIDIAPKACDVFFIHGILSPLGRGPERVNAAGSNCLSNTPPPGCGSDSRWTATN